MSTPTATLLLVTRGGARSHPGSLEPHCFDREGSDTILPMQLRWAEMGYAGAVMVIVVPEFVEPDLPADVRAEVEAASLARDGRSRGG